MGGGALNELTMGGGARAADPSPWQRFFAGLGPWDTASEFTRFSFGALFFATVAPFVFSSALLSTLWEAVDRGFSGGVFLSGQEQTGFLLARVVPWINRLTHPINKRFVKNPVDSYMVNAVLLFGAVIPGLFLLCGLHTLRNGGHMSWLLCLAYHQFRLGPFVMNFGWVYALSHTQQVTGPLDPAGGAAAPRAPPPEAQAAHKPPRGPATAA